MLSYVDIYFFVLSFFFSSSSDFFFRNWSWDTKKKTKHLRVFCSSKKKKRLFKTLPDINFLTVNDLLCVYGAYVYMCVSPPGVFFL